jgi:hypothetical protein
MSDISGCTKSTDGTSLTVIGIGNSQPVTLTMNPSTGAVDKYINLEYYLTSATVVPVYKTFGAAFLDNKDVYDGKSYYYSAFLMDNKIELVRVLNSDNPLVDWS